MFAVSLAADDGAAGNGGNEGARSWAELMIARGRIDSCDTPPAWRRSIAWRAMIPSALAATAWQTTHICGFSVSAIGGTAAVGPITIANTVTGRTAVTLAFARVS